ncbi:MAG: hypothetical protein JO243_09550, partial [Solirubrobacterales bacterium]|nr:hypothetical protein [Solirubrobacterales bacterium]
MAGPPRKRIFHEAAHKTAEAEHDLPVEASAGVRSGQRPLQKRSFNEAAHKLGYWAPPGASASELESEATRRRFEALADANRDVIAHGSKTVLALGAL